MTFPKPNNILHLFTSFIFLHIPTATFMKGNVVSPNQISDHKALIIRNGNAPAGDGLAKPDTRILYVIERG